ncbi:MAG: radical SAM/CxCxxxxC motif protein YfkAB, partial [Bacillus sp. (in: firmicutes)]
SSIANELSCHCPAVKCLGPNILVKNSYYQEVDFTNQHNQIKI